MLKNRFSSFTVNPRILLLAALLLSGLLPLPVRAAALSDTVDVLRYRLHLDVLNLPSKNLKGMTEVTLLSKQPLLQTVSLELKQLTVDSVKAANGTFLPFSHANSLIRITLPNAITPTDTVTLKIYYHGIPFAESWGGFHFAGAYAFNLGVGFESIPHNLGKAWFPCVDDFKDRAYYEYYIRTENANKAVCGGILQSVADQGDGTHTFYWKSNRTIPTYLASLAVGPYTLLTDTFTGMDTTVPICYYVRPADSTKVPGAFANLKSIASIYESCFGAYPFERIGITGTSLGAMEHAENIFYPNGSLAGGLTNEWLYAHELSHMWFGDEVTCASDADMWLNEGWARWAETLFTELLYGDEAAGIYYNNLLADVLQKTHITDDGYRALSPMPAEYTYGSTVYDKGAVVVHALRGYMGDSLFFRGVKDYLNTYAWQPADSYQLRDALSLSSGIDLTGFFDFYVFNPGFTHFSVDSLIITPQCSGFRVDAFIKQKLKGTEVYAQNCLVDLTFMGANRHQVTFTAAFSGVNGVATTTIGFKPEVVMVDLYNKTGDATTDEAKNIKTTGVTEFAHTYCKIDIGRLTDSAFVRVTHHWVAPDSLMKPVPGLTLSSRRYWSVEGVFPEGYDATGIFQYNKGLLDSDLIFSSADSLVILYRAHAGHEWQSVPFTRTGPWQIGFLNVPHLQPGEYTLAIWDAAWVNASDIPASDKFLQIYPNPGKGKLMIQSSTLKPAILKIHNASGQELYSGRLNEGQQYTWCGKPGTYLVTLLKQGRVISSLKGIIR